jgi:hypothetical protein
MSKNSFIGLAILVMLASATASQETDSKDKLGPLVTKEQPMSFWMDKKLEYSKKVLEALTSGRYEDIETNAEQMRLLGKIEGFVRRRSPSYSSHLRSFDLATQELTRQSRAKNVEGATLAFHQLTTSCVACHQSLREVSPIPKEKEEDSK